MVRSATSLAADAVLVGVDPGAVVEGVVNVVFPGGGRQRQHVIIQYSQHVG